MNKVIIYGSKYGAALEYAKELSKKMEIPLISYKKVKNINEYDSVIYIGALYAGGVCGMSKTLKNWDLSVEKELVLITVGISDPESLKNTTAIKNNIKLKLPAELFEKASIYHLRGSIDYSKLSFLHKMMMGMVYKKAKETPLEEQDAETKAMIETYNKKADFINLESLNPIIEKNK